MQEDISLYLSVPLLDKAWKRKQREKERSRRMNHHIIPITLHIYKQVDVYPVERKKCQMYLWRVSVLGEIAFRKETGLNGMHFREKTKNWINIYKCAVSRRQINGKFHKSTSVYVIGCVY